MESDKIRIVWNGKLVHGEPEVLGNVDTTVPNVLQVLKALGRHPNEFNESIVEAKVKPHLFLPCVLWMRGEVVGEVIRKLKDEGLCVEVSK